MEKNQIVLLMIIGIFALTVLLTVWLTKRATPQKRFYWFAGCSIVSTFILGIFQVPVSIIVSLIILALLKSENDKPLSDVGSGLLVILGSGVQLAFFGLYFLLGVGGIYWLWLAIQIKSFLMFIIGIFPLAYIITVPVGAYSLIFDTPAWVISWFG